jgi:hypothetical protein
MVTPGMGKMILSRIDQGSSVTNEDRLPAARPPG